MKFFTMEWWKSNQHDDEHPEKELNYEPFKIYGAYLTSIQEKIPPSIKNFYGKVPLHDAQLYVISYSPESTTLTFVMSNFNMERMKHRRFYLQYSGVTSFESTANADFGFFGIGYGDLGYEENDMTPDGKFEHRILFSTGIELDVICQDAYAWWDNVEADSSK